MWETEHLFPLKNPNATQLLHGKFSQGPPTAPWKNVVTRTLVLKGW